MEVNESRQSRRLPDFPQLGRLSLQDGADQTQGVVVLPPTPRLGGLVAVAHLAMTDGSRLDMRNLSST